MRSTNHYFPLLLIAACNPELGSITGEEASNSGGGGSSSTSQPGPTSGEPEDASAGTWAGSGDLSAETGAVDDSTTTTGMPMTTDPPATATSATTDTSTTTTTDTTDTSTGAVNPPVEKCVLSDTLTSMEWHYRDTLTPGPADRKQVYGYFNEDLGVVGDWNNDSFDTPGVFRKGCWIMTDNYEASEGTPPFEFGDPGDIPVVGDWNGPENGIKTDTVGYYRGTTFYLRYSNTPGLPDKEFDIGVAGIPVAGDWNGDRRDGVGVFVDGHWKLHEFEPEADYEFDFGTPGTIPVIGDWNNDLIDTVGVVESTMPFLTWKLRMTSNVEGEVKEFTYGEPGDIPLAGDWTNNGDNTHGIAIMR